MDKRTLMLRLYLSLSLMLGLTVLFPGGVRAQDQVVPPPRPIDSRGTGGGGSITGRVVLPSGQPVEGRVRITLSSMLDPSMTIYTDNSGGFGFPNLPEATYTIEVSADPKIYEIVTQEVRLIRSTKVNLVISLKEKGAPTAKKTDTNIISAAELDTGVPDSAKKEYRKGVSLLNEGKVPEAIERFKKAINIYPNYLAAHNDLGVQYLGLNRLPDAAEQFEAAIEINPKAFNPQLNLGIVLVRQKKYVSALDYLRVASSIDSSSAAAHLYIGIATAETDELEEAERELTKAISLGTIEYAIGHYYLGQVYLKRGERELAIRELKAYIDKAPAGEMVARARAQLEQIEK